MCQIDTLPMVRGKDFLRQPTYSNSVEIDFNNCSIITHSELVGDNASLELEKYFETCIFTHCVSFLSDILIQDYSNFVNVFDAFVIVGKNTERKECG